MSETDLSQESELECPACGETMVKEIYWNTIWDDFRDNFTQDLLIELSCPECGYETELSD